jgi:glycosyltransferase involved in cell wall biosynthesis
MRTKNNGEIVVVIPTLNEAKGVGPTLAELKEVLEDPRFLVIDANSVDGTADVARKMDAEVFLQKGKGKGLAVAQVLSRVNSDARYVVFIDADFTYPAMHIPHMIKILETDSSVGMVLGNRFNAGFDLKRSMTDAYYFGNRMIAFAHMMTSGVRISDPLTGLRVVPWALLRNWRPKSRNFDIEAELNFYVAKKGYGIAEIPITYRPRLGEKKLGIRHGSVILRRILSEAFT